MFCTNCGTKINDGDSFCTNCGTKVEKESIDDTEFNLLTFIEEIKNTKLVTEYSEDTLVNDLDTVKFGSYPQNDVSGKTKEPIEWIVLEIQNDKALLLSKFIIDCKSYHNEQLDITWENCDLRK